ncbi:YbdK family carboxylate-amine ligase [Streptomyces sp. BG9H]|uniref:Putative glutamate--cysteine ligase 2 n=1 Tax=Streptomyces anatolicus TaxID=2675858 RepID=A0ABS6YHN5_9ACTN|nr:YbdK family carboxylate-amine ligase [Streptomyces anatolicus]MBW5420102.1 YbdK family carboxylate-amine ligase [Streptomyces anatolicus]
MITTAHTAESASRLTPPQRKSTLPLPWADRRGSDDAPERTRDHGLVDDSNKAGPRRRPAERARHGGWPPTVGVEEELFLVDSASGAVVAAAPQVLGRAAPVLGDLVAGEFTKAQVEIRTPPCTRVEELHAHLVRLRQALAACAAQEGVWVCPFATPVIARSPLPVGGHPRYRASVELYRSLMDDFAICALHVHVALPDCDMAVRVSNHLRAWLPLLVEMTANSPFHQGRDTKFASWRSVIRLSLPSLGPPPYAESFEDYRRTAQALTAVGTMPFADLPFWDIRPHPHLPTLEVRCTDVPADPADSAAAAAIIRALVVTSARLVESGDHGPRLRGELLRGAYWYSTRDGWSGQGLDALSGAMLPAPERGHRLVDHIGDVLEELGDLPRVTAFLERLAAGGSGAHRQRAAYRAGGLSRVVADLKISP